MPVSILKTRKSDIIMEKNYVCFTMQIKSTSFIFSIAAVVTILLKYFAENRHI